MRGELAAESPGRIVSRVPHHGQIIASGIINELRQAEIASHVEELTVRRRRLISQQGITEGTVLTHPSSATTYVVRRVNSQASLCCSTSGSSKIIKFAPEVFFPE